MCGDIWPSEDGARLFTACGNAFRASDIAAEDMTYNGALAGLTSVGYVDASVETLLVASVAGSTYSSNGSPSVSLHDYQYLTALATITLPDFLVGNNAYDTMGRFVFFSADGTTLHVLGQAHNSSGLLQDYALISYDVGP